MKRKHFHIFSQNKCFIAAFIWKPKISLDGPMLDEGVTESDAVRPGESVD